MINANISQATLGVENEDHPAFINFGDEFQIPLLTFNCNNMPEICVSSCFRSIEHTQTTL